MKNFSNYEQKSIFQKTKEYFSLFIFVIIILLLAVFLSDIIVFPITMLAIEKEHLFTELFTTTILIFLILYLSLKFFTSVMFIKKYKLSFNEILNYFILNKLKSFIIFLVLLVFFSLITILTIKLLENNYYFIYKLLN